jgi:hypothetical protein
MTILKRRETPLNSSAKTRSTLKLKPDAGKGNSTCATCDKSSRPTKGRTAKASGIADFLAKKLFGSADAPQTVQQSIPYREMMKDGICRLVGRHYTKTVVFGDINYQLGATRSHTNTIPRGAKLCGRLDHVVLKMGGFQ